MKSLMFVFLSVLMAAPAGFAFEQADLDVLQNAEELSQEIDLSNVSDAKLTQVNHFFRGRKFRCVARNRGGRRFVGKARRLPRARRRAMRECRMTSFRPRTCRIVRCKRRRGGLRRLLDLLI